MTKCTIVTFFFNLKDLKDTSPGTRPAEFYLKNGRHTLQIDNPMIIFCDSDTKGLIKNLREELSDSPTIYVEKNISAYEHYKFNWPLVNENRNKSAYYKDPSSRVTASYLLTTTFKILALKIAKDRNDFKSSHFIWVDFGGGHVLGPTLKEDVSLILANPKEKVAIMYIHYRLRNVINNMIDYCNNGYCGLAGTVFSVEKSYMDNFYSLMMSIFYEQLSLGVGHCEEQVLTYCYHRHPELFNLHYGDYYSAASNYHYVKKDYDSVKQFFIKNTIDDGRQDLAKMAALNIKQSLELGHLQLPLEEQLFINNIINS